MMKCSWPRGWSKIWGFFFCCCIYVQLNHCFGSKHDGGKGGKRRVCACVYVLGHIQANVWHFYMYMHAIIWVCLHTCVYSCRFWQNLSVCNYEFCMCVFIRILIIMLTDTVILFPYLLITNIYWSWWQASRSRQSFHTLKSTIWKRIVRLPSINAIFFFKCWVTVQNEITYSIFFVQIIKPLPFNHL